MWKLQKIALDIATVSNFLNTKTVSIYFGIASTYKGKGLVNSWMEIKKLGNMLGSLLLIFPRFLNVTLNGTFQYELISSF